MVIMSSDEMNEQREEIEESLDDLLIFPTLKGFRRSTEAIKSYFALEIEFMKQHNSDDAASQSITDSHEAIKGIGMKELNGRVQNASSPDESSCWVAPKSINKGVDKNVAARLAAAFAEHIELFDSMLCDEGGKK